MPDSKHIPPHCDIDRDKLGVKLHELIPSDTRLIEGAIAKVLRLLEDNGWDQDLGNVHLALHEALMNAVLHGNRSDPEKYVQMWVTLEEDGGVLIVVKDSGPGFDPDKIPDPTVGENVYRDCGRGVYLIKQLMDEVEYKFDNGTAIVMRYHPANREP